MTNSSNGRNKTHATPTFHELLKSTVFRRSMTTMFIGIAILFLSGIFEGKLRTIINLIGCVIAVGSVNPILKFISSGK